MRHRLAEADTLVRSQPLALTMDDDTNPLDLNAVFTTEFNGVIERKGLTDAQVAQRLNISPEVVERWKQGVSSPFPNIREFVLKDLEDA